MEELIKENEKLSTAYQALVLVLAETEKKRKRLEDQIKKHMEECSVCLEFFIVHHYDDFSYCCDGCENFLICPACIRKFQLKREMVPDNLKFFKDNNLKFIKWKYLNPTFKCQNCES